MRKWIFRGLAGVLVMLMLYLLTLPGCRSGEMMIINSTGHTTREIVIRMDGQDLWRGALDAGEGTRATFSLPGSGDLAAAALLDTGRRLNRTGLYTASPSDQKWLLVIRDDDLDAVLYSPALAFYADSASLLGQALYALRLLTLVASCPVRALVPPIP